MIIDIIIIILVVLGAFAGFKKGLVGILVSLVGLILAIILALTLQTPVAEYLYNTGMGSSINQTVTSGINNAFNNKEESKDNDNNADFYETVIENMTGKEQITEASKNVTMFVLKGISFIGIFLAVTIICYILSMILNLVFDLPILHSINKIGGIAAGAIKSLISIWVLLAIVSLLAPLLFMQGIIVYIQNSAIASMLYYNNLFVKLISIGLNWV